MIFIYAMQWSDKDAYNEKLLKLAGHSRITLRNSQTTRLVWITS